jgi:hypothetical protein
MKYAPHPDADKRAQQMVWRGRGRTAVDAVRPPVEALEPRPLPSPEPKPQAQPEPDKRDE